VESPTKGLKGNHSVSYDDIPESIDKQCIQFVIYICVYIYIYI
jgi:hypothetical protein